MTEFLIVLGIILALAVLSVLFVLSLRGTLTISYDGEFGLSFKVLFITFRIFPARKKAKHYRKTMSRRKAKRIRRSAQRKNDFLSRLKEKIFGKKDKKESETEEKSKKTTETSASNDIPVGTVAREVIDILSTFTEIVGVLVKRFTHHLRIKIARLKVKIATEDPAITAVTYGAASQIVNVLLPILRQVEHLGLPKEKNFELSYDFLSTAPEIDLKVSFSLRTWHVADIAIRSLIGGISKYVGRKGGIDKTVEHISGLIDRFVPKDKANEKASDDENKK